MPANSLFGPKRGRHAEVVGKKNQLYFAKSLAGHDYSFEQFRRMPGLFPTLEMCMGFGTLCCVRMMLEVILSLLTLVVMPWRCTTRDLIAGFLVLAGLTPFLLTTSADAPMFLYSYWYHAIRGTSLLKLYVIYNMLELGEKLLASFNHDAVEAVWVSVQRLRRKREGGGKEQERVFFAWVLVLTFGSTALHAFLHMLQIVTLNVALNSDDYSLVAMLISNNFAEIKSAMFKKNTVENLFQHLCSDMVERVQHIVCIAVILLRHAHSEGFGTVEPLDLATILAFEVLVDFAKHFFIARFNRIELSVYDRFHMTLVWDTARTYFADELARRFMLQRTELGTDDDAVSPVPHARTESDPSATKPTGIDTPPKATPKRQLSSDDQLLLRSIYSPNTCIRNPCRRLGFTPYSRVAVLLWASTHLISTAGGAVCVVLVLSLVALQGVIAATVDGIAAKFIVRSGRWARLGAKPVVDSARDASILSPQRHSLNPLTSPGMSTRKPRPTTLKLPTPVLSSWNTPLRRNHDTSLNGSLKGDESLRAPHASTSRRGAEHSGSHLDVPSPMPDSGSETTSPQATFMRYAGPMNPGFAYSVDVGLEAASFLLGPTVHRGVSPTNAPANDSLEQPQTPPRQMSDLIDPLDDVYPYQRVEGEKSHKPHGRTAAKARVTEVAV
jgi:hypothetical protein